MRTKNKRLISLACVLLTVLMLLAGCAQQAGQTDGVIKLVLLCDDSMGFGAQSYERGVWMAVDEYTGPNTVSLDIYESGDTFEDALKLNNEKAADPSVTAILSIQDYDVVDAAAKAMEENGKTFFALHGYLEDTVKRGYETFFPFSLNAEHLGYAMGLYAAQSGAKRIGCIHSDTSFEQQEATAFERALLRSEEGRTVSSLSEPFTSQEFYSEMEAWKALGIDTAYVPYYEPEWAADVLAVIKEELPDITLLSCFRIEDREVIERLGEANGIIMPAYYPVDRSGEYEEWAERFYERYGAEPDNEAVQGYDAAKLILAAYTGDNTSLARNIRENAPNAGGIGGNIVYDLLNGLPDPEDEAGPYDYEYLMMKDGVFTVVQ
ncbi:ABC transporter substrate-binding protein [Christensenella tenuis]|uniref:ABC transporter substrate-binding protein n=1 Tax=Christensenella tenuis TaxID=2763033 RepID=A0ABR7EF81_9FIRM|nr:ABC transporter substrate-binding protein [Christensenella tenuis]MBC5647694.1 ABC transporter substrate-binding protein [Christensenella tenuis]